MGPQLRTGWRSRDADLTLGQYSSVVAPAHRPSDSEAETAPAPAGPPSPSGERQSVPEHGAGRHIPALLFLGNGLSLPPIPGPSVLDASPPAIELTTVRIAARDAAFASTRLLPETDL